ncbi:hypothetical protein [Frankia sp. CiP3]|uniref:hypothetical protein n=1 Tax=Frankia sp. CiP3 TaxID=2880971 RepID=UPI001EF44526|nr:hypothetical protein [Frankia sp. CiP3]
MASLYPKKINGKAYYSLREMARVDGKPKMVSERYLGSAEDIAAAVAAREAASLPERTRHLAFGDVAAVWGVLARLGVADVVDEVTRARRADAGASVGTYLALAALNRVVAPCSKSAFADWWATTAADRFTKIENRVLDHRRFWNAMQAVARAELAEIERRLALRAAEIFELDVSAVALDMTNFATYIDSTNAEAPLAQRERRSRSATTCASWAWAWWSPATAGSRWSPTPTPATSPTSPSSPRYSTNSWPGTPPSPPPAALPPPR